jgi:transposase-like protein
MQSPGTENQLNTLQTFDRLFPTEEDCVGFLFPLRWSRGFVCPFCRTRHPQLQPQRYLVCPHCGNRSSLTTGTLMHGAKKPIRDWLLAIWWFSSSSFDVSAKELQRLLGVSCYQTAWTWLQKLRLAMGQADADRCRGVVEIGCGPVAPAYERKERALVLTVAEIVLSLGITGRIRMRHIAELNDTSLTFFLQETVRENSTLLTDNEQLLNLLGSSDAYYVAPSQPRQFSRVQELNRSFETCLHTVHRGGVTVKHLQLYLDEFCFRNNASLLPDHQAVFKALLGGVLSESIDQYRQVIQAGPPGQFVGRPL